MFSADYHVGNINFLTNTLGFIYAFYALCTSVYYKRPYTRTLIESTKTTSMEDVSTRVAFC